jgi:hypothetical protein
METLTLVDAAASSRELIRQLRTGSSSEGEGVLPESVAWHVYLELRKRQEPRAEHLFIHTLRHLHSRRSLAGTVLPVDDHLPDEHRMSDDPFLADLWKAYKKCIRFNRTGPASQLLRDIEEQINKPRS